MHSEKKLGQMARIKELSGALGVEILAHFYQRPEVKAVADYVGGSRGVFRRVQKTASSAILLCGVSFMTETIGRLRPGLNVLVPRADAGCPFSEAVAANAVWEIRQRDPKALVVADAKAPGAIKDLADALMPIDADQSYWNNRDQNQRLYILPDQGDQGHPPCVCQVHWQVELAALAQAKRDWPKALVAANVLCRDEVKARADKVGDSQAIWEFCGESPNDEFIVVAETGLAESLALTYRHKRFYDPGVEIFCPNMKLTNLRDLISALESYQLRAGLLTRFGARAPEGRLSHDIP
jgi:quinolinate synthase